MRWLGIAWNIAAIWFLLSVVSAPFFLVIRKSRARGRRLFRDLPNERIDHLKPVTDNSHIWDA
jgi:hypothetical protein